MILTHQEGLKKIEDLRKIFPREIELVCLNSDFFDITKMLEAAEKLSDDHSDKVVLKESEFHEKHVPYYEVSIFSTAELLDKTVDLVESYGLQTDIIHDDY